MGTNAYWVRRKTALAYRLRVRLTLPLSGRPIFLNESRELGMACPLEGLVRLLTGSQCLSL